MMVMMMTRWTGDGVENGVLQLKIDNLMYSWIQSEQTSVEFILVFFIN